MDPKCKQGKTNEKGDGSAISVKPTLAGSLRFVSHVPGLQNVFKDALSRQFDKEDLPLWTSTITHMHGDIDLDLVAAEQRQDIECFIASQITSLDLQWLDFPGVRHHLLCDVSLDWP